MSLHLELEPIGLLVGDATLTVRFGLCAGLMDNKHVVFVEVGAVLLVVVISGAKDRPVGVIRDCLSHRVRPSAV